MRARDVAPGVVEDMRYASANNFTARRVPGYEAGRCLLLKPVAQALAKAAAAAEREGYRLVLHDCYRPQRATAAFVRWARDLKDEATKAEYYPRVAKSALFSQGYIGRFSAHSTGTAIDLSMQRADGTALDFGSRYDFFDPVSATAAPVGAQARANRMKLKAFMEAAGLRNYAREWWHYSLGVPGAPAMDVPVAD